MNLLIRKKESHNKLLCSSEDKGVNAVTPAMETTGHKLNLDAGNEQKIRDTYF